MEKLFLWLSLLVPFGAFGQACLSFANTAQTLFTTNGSCLGLRSGPVSGANAYRIGLYVAPDGTTLESAFTLVAVGTNSTAQPGRINFPGNPFCPPGNNGEPIAFQVKAWSLSCGASYEAALASGCTNSACYVGKSQIGRVTPRPGFPPPSLFGSGEFPGQLTNGIELTPVICVCQPGIHAMRAGSNVTLRLEGPSAQQTPCRCNYQVQAASFVTGPWTNLNAAFTLPGSGVLELTDTNPPTPRFYRVRVQ